MNFIKNWINALRSGKYKQGQGFLKYVPSHLDEKSSPTYCCLGVALDLIDPSCKSLNMIPREGGALGHRSYGYYINDQMKAKLLELAPNLRFKRAGNQESDTGGWSIALEESHAACMNDAGHDFAYIADAIEREYLR